MAGKVVVFRDKELEDPDSGEVAGDIMAFNYENEDRTLEENIKILKNDSRIIYMGEYDYTVEEPPLPAD